MQREKAQHTILTKRQPIETLCEYASEMKEDNLGFTRPHWQVLRLKARQGC
jgi:hypothetical protein